MNQEMTRTRCHPSFVQAYKEQAMTNDERKNTSKFLSYVLRHRPDEIGLELDCAGWADVDLLLVKCEEHGREISFEDFERKSFPDLHEKAMKIFDRYSVIMLSYYKENVKAIPGAEDVFMWCRQQNIKVVTDTGFHRDINNAIMDGLGWVRNQLIDLSVDVETTGGVGRPAPYMIFYAMQQLGVQSVHEVVKIGDTPADLLSGFNAGFAGNIGVLSGANSRETLTKYPHTHILNSINELPGILT